MLPLCRFYVCIEHMVGYRVNYYWFVCWVFLAPAFMVVSFNQVSLSLSRVYFDFFPVPVLVLLCEVCPHLDGRLQVSSLGGGSGLHDLLLLHALGSW